MEKRADKSLINCKRGKCRVGKIRGGITPYNSVGEKLWMKNRKVPVCHSGQVEHKSAVCTCSRGGQLHAALARVPEKVKGGVSFLLSCGKTNSGVLRALVGSPLHERYGRTGVSPAEAIKMVRGLKHMMWRRRLS